MTLGPSRHPLRVPGTPHDVFRVVCAGSPYAVWWDSHGERGNGVSYIALGEPLELTSNWRNEVRTAWESLSLPPGETCHVPLGIHLMLPYEVGAENLGLSTPGALIPRALEVIRLLEVAHDSGAITAHWLPIAEDSPEWATRVERELESALPAPDPVLPVLHEALWRDSEQRYLEMISQAQQAIADGEVYQLCLTTHLTIPGAVDPVALHRVMRDSNPTHHQALVRFPDVSVVSASPETFLSVSSDRTVTTRPIKGTRPRGSTLESDVALREELVVSEKERAENLMIVDLMRNDLSRVCEVGTVEVPELLVVEEYATVHQLVSTVTGRLRKEVDVMDVLDATFPAGSMTGAPKRRAVEILAEMESGPRGLYSGTFGVWRADGSAEFAMTIRTAVVADEALTLGVGGGITALSEPHEEVREVGIKASGFLSALGVNQVGYS